MIDNEQLKKLIKYLVYNNIIRSQSDFAAKLGYERSTISGMVSGQKPITAIFANKVVSMFGVNQEWMNIGCGEMINQTTFLHLAREGVMEVSPDAIHEGDYTGTLVYDIDAVCGTDNRTMTFTKEMIIGSVNLPGIKSTSHIITASGDSMQPRICNGDRIVIREVEDMRLLIYGQIYMVITEEYRLLKYVRRHKTDPETMIVLKSDNPDYDDIDIPKDQIVKLFVVENILSIKNVL